MRKTSKVLMGVSIGRNVEVSMKKGGFWMYGRKRFGEKAEVFVEMWGFHGGMTREKASRRMTSKQWNSIGKRVMGRMRWDVAILE